MAYFFARDSLRMGLSHNLILRLTCSQMKSDPSMIYIDVCVNQGTLMRTSLMVVISYQFLLDLCVLPLGTSQGIALPLLSSFFFLHTVITG